MVEESAPAAPRGLAALEEPLPGLTQDTVDSAQEFKDYDVTI